MPASSVDRIFVNRRPHLEPQPRVPMRDGLSKAKMIRKKSVYGARKCCPILCRFKKVWTLFQSTLLRVRDSRGIEKRLSNHREPKNSQKEHDQYLAVFRQ